jgi:hypothetical protein
MFKSMSQELNDTHRDIIEIKSYLGLPADTYHELPKFDDLFIEWDAVDEAATAAAHAPLPHLCRRTRVPTRSRRSPSRGQQIFDEDVETEEEEPQDYREHPDFDEDEDTSDEDAQDDDE